MDMEFVSGIILYCVGRTFMIVIVVFWTPESLSIVRVCDLPYLRGSFVSFFNVVLGTHSLCKVFWIIVFSYRFEVATFAQASSEYSFVRDYFFTLFLQDLSRHRYWCLSCTCWRLLKLRAFQ
ncbi:hypothetical protein M758_3G134900 [Ceratodon purpureus]|nr:hypothetical protein M758_3G134900 [Ceratodon purpureus]